MDRNDACEVRLGSVLVSLLDPTPYGIEPVGQGYSRSMLSSGTVEPRRPDTQSYSRAAGLSAT